MKSFTQKSLRQLGLLTVGVYMSAAPWNTLRADSDRQFLGELMKDTWSCLDAMRHPKTGLPCDTQKHEGLTNTTNIGLYLASLCVARELDYVTPEDGRNRVEKILTSLESYNRMHGFMPNFIEVDLSTSESKGVMAVSDFNKLATGLIMARQTWPALDKRISRFLDKIEWSRLYDAKTGLVGWGYDFDNDRCAGWGRLWLTADTRSAAFMMVATGAAPPEIWKRMDRQHIQTPYGTICRGYELGGLFLHAMDGIFLPETYTEVGESAGNLAWQQIQFARKKAYPLWGWSNCYKPDDGYTEGGFLSEHVVTPHCVALMIEYYPKHVTANLRKMTKLGGTAPPNGYEEKKWGLRDSYNMQTKRWDHRYLSLDQGMLFLSLANYLHDGVARKIYGRDSQVKHGLKLLTPYMQNKPELITRWKQRDSQCAIQKPIPQAERKPSVHKVPLSDVQSNRPRLLTVQKQGEGTALIKLDRKEMEVDGKVTITFPALDLQHLDKVELNLAVLDSTPGPVGAIRLLVTDCFGQQRYAHFELSKDQSTYSIPAKDLWGIWIDSSKVDTIQLQFWTNPWFYTSQRWRAQRSSLWLKSIRFHCQL